MSLDERFQKLFSALFDNNENVRHNSADMLVGHCQRNGIHPSDIHFGHGTDLIVRQNDVIKRLQVEKEELFRETAYLRSMATSTALRQVKQAIRVENHWTTFIGLLRDRMYGETLPFGWKTQTCLRFSLELTELKRWETGIAQIPGSVLEQLRAMPLGPIKSPSPPASQYTSQTEARDHAVDLFFRQGLPTKDIAAVTGLSLKQVNGLFWGAPVRRHWEVEIQTTGPTTWAEVWTIGSILWGGCWLTQVISHLGLPKKTRPPHDLAGVPQLLIDGLRHDALAARADRSARRARRRPSSKAASAEAEPVYAAE